MTDDIGHVNGMRIGMTLTFIFILCEYRTSMRLIDMSAYLTRLPN